MADREDMIRMCPLPGANRTTSEGIFSLAMLLLHSFIGNLFRLVCLYLEMPLVATVLRFVVWAVRGKRSESERDNPLLRIGIFMVMGVPVVRVPVKAVPGCIPVYASVSSVCAQHTVLSIGSIQTLRHPDVFFEQNPINATEPVGKDGEAFLETKCLKVDEACRVESSVPVLIGAKVVGTLVKKHFFIELCQ